MITQKSPLASRPVKTPKLQFSLRLDWLERTNGIITANNVKDAIRVATPPVFGGEGEEWSPEHLLISAVASCFMSTYLYYAGKQQLDTCYLTCLGTGQITLQNGQYIFTGIDLYPKIYVLDEERREQALTVLKTTECHCRVSNALSIPVVYHSEVLKDPHPWA
jgi:organic hydroperoxide reductase OsmC/OhrA